MTLRYNNAKYNNLSTKSSLETSIKRSYQVSQSLVFQVMKDILCPAMFHLRGAQGCLPLYKFQDESAI